MINDTLSHKLNGGKVVKKKKTNSSPLSKKYKKFLNSENIQLSTSKKERPQLSMNNPDLKINVIKKNEIANENYKLNPLTNYSKANSLAEK